MHTVLMWVPGWGEMLVIMLFILIFFGAKDGQWEKALEILHLMEEKGVTPNAFTFNTVINACVKDGQWEKALESLRMLPRRSKMRSTKELMRLIQLLPALVAKQKPNQ